MKTIRQWFESVKDEKLRNELLGRMSENSINIKVNSLIEALDHEFKVSVSLTDSDYFDAILDQALNNEIELI